MGYSVIKIRFMKTRFMTILALMALAYSYAGGFRIALQGQRALAMGHTGVAVVNSSEVAFFNPAGMSFLEEKLSVSFGMNAIFSNIAFQNEEFGYSARSERNVPTCTPLVVNASTRRLM